MKTVAVAASRRLNALFICALLVALACGLLVAGVCGTDNRLSACPRLMLWAWENPADLSFIDPEKTGVAYLAGTVALQSDSVSVKSRRQPLKVAAGTYMMAVVRIEANRKDPPTLSDKQLQDLVVTVKDVLATKPVRALQIDFDARRSERAFYRQLIAKLRQGIPDDMPLSITSLASWCLQDTWIKDMPCDEVVPMCFRIGADRKRVLFDLSDGVGLAAMPMEEAIGLSIDEPDVVAKLKCLPARTYIFAPGGWASARAGQWVKTFETRGERWKELAER